ncbi:MAG: hemerythrin family protein [Methylophaga sp.]|nr:hemerythrin family protein [Methylophaga sp.]
MKIKWTKELSVNNERIDIEHQMYFDLLNHICNESEKGASKERVVRLINEFVQFVRFHFMSEENVMIDTGYSGYAEHTRAHNYCLESVKTKVFAFKNDEIAVEEIVDFAVEWFFMHVSSLDKQLGKHLALL